MKMQENPFNPYFGKRPDIFIGRSEIKREFLNALNQPNSPWRSTIVTGVRGTGKTVLLSETSESLPKSAIVLSVSAEPGFLDNILAQLYNQLNSLQQAKRTISSLNLSVNENGLTMSKQTPAFLNTFRNQLTTLMGAFNHEKLFVFLIDEVQKHTDEMRTFVSTFQHLVRENYNLALLVAGLPQALSDLLNDEVLTFFRRSNQIVLQNVEIALVQLDYHDVFFPMALDDETIGAAAEASLGYPYLIQLIGFYIWESLTRGGENQILERALIRSKSDLFRNVHDIIFSELSSGDRQFIFAMAEDEMTSRRSAIEKRLEKDRSYVSTYRARLIAAGVIQASGYGELRFTIPYMREYLLQKMKEL